MRPLRRAQRRQKCVRDVEDAGEIDRDDVFPILDHGLSRAQHAVAAGDAGIVDQDRDLSDLVGDAFGDRDAILALGHIERETLALPPPPRISAAASAAAFSFIARHELNE